MKKENKPILLNFEGLAFEHEVSLIKNKVIPFLEQIKTAFLELGIGKLTDFYLDDILNNKMKKIVEELELDYRKQTSSRFLDKTVSGNINSIIKRIYGIRNQIFAEGFPSLSMFVYYPSVDENGNIVLSDEALQNIKDTHSVYVVTDKGIELYHAHHKAANALDEFYQLGKANIQSDNLGDLFEVEGGKVVATIQDYDWFYYAREA